jgi:hypothetical protein
LCQSQSGIEFVVWLLDAGLRSVEATCIIQSCVPLLRAIQVVSLLRASEIPFWLLGDSHQDNDASMKNAMGSLNWLLLPMSLR